MFLFPSESIFGEARDTNKREKYKTNYIHLPPKGGACAYPRVGGLRLCICASL